MMTVLGVIAIIIGLLIIVAMIAAGPIVITSVVISSLMGFLLTGQVDVSAGSGVAGFIVGLIIKKPAKFCA